MKNLKSFCLITLSSLTLACSTSEQVYIEQAKSSNQVIQKSTTDKKTATTPKVLPAEESRSLDSTNIERVKKRFEEMEIEETKKGSPN